MDKPIYQLMFGGTIIKIIVLLVQSIIGIFFSKHALGLILLTGMVTEVMIQNFVVLMSILRCHALYTDKPENLAKFQKKFVGYLVPVCISYSFVIFGTCWERIQKLVSKFS